MAEATTPSRPVVRGLRGSVCNRPAASSACAGGGGGVAHAFARRGLLGRRRRGHTAALGGQHALPPPCVPTALGLIITHSETDLHQAVHQHEQPLVDLLADLLHAPRVLLVRLPLHRTHDKTDGRSLAPWPGAAMERS